MNKVYKFTYGKINITLLSVEHYKSKHLVDKLLNKEKFDNLLIEANMLTISTIKVNNMTSSEIYTIITEYQDKIIPIDISFNREIKYYMTLLPGMKRDEVILNYLIDKEYFKREIFTSKEYYDTFILYREEQMFNRIREYIVNNKETPQSILILTGYFHFPYIKKQLKLL